MDIFNSETASLFGEQGTVLHKMPVCDAWTKYPAQRCASGGVQTTFAST